MRVNYKNCIPFFYFYFFLPIIFLALPIRSTTVHTKSNQNYNFRGGDGFGERNGKEVQVYTNNHQHDHNIKCIKSYNILLKNEINQSKNIDGFKMNYENWMAEWPGLDRTGST